MRILAISDIHGRDNALVEVLEKHRDITTVIFLGDGLLGVEDTAALYPDRTFITVKGNCDHSPLTPTERVELLGNRRLFITHGHKYNVKYGLYNIDLAARERKATVALFGHTHQPLSDYADGMYLCNPGSLGYDGRYAILDVNDAGVMISLMSLYA